MKKKIVLFLAFLCSLFILIEFTKEDKKNSSLPIFSTIIKLHKSLITTTYSLCSSYIYDTKEVFKEETEFATIIIHYIDTLGNIIHEDVIYDKKVGKYYEINSLDISGYILVEVIGKENGLIENNYIEVTYIYEKI